MIFNNLHKRSLGRPDAVQLQGLLQANPRQSSLDTSEEFQTLEGDEIPHQNRGIFCYDDFVFLSDNVNCWVVRVSDISVLEACGN